MDLHERIGHFILGMILGYVLGVLVTRFREKKEERTEVHELVKKRVRNEDGFMRNPIVADIVVGLAFMLCFWAAVSTQITNSKLQENIKRDDVQDAQIGAIAFCNQTALQDTLTALNARADYTQDRADAGVAAQQAQLVFLQTIANPNVTEEQSMRAFKVYTDVLDSFVDASDKAKDKIEENPFPEVSDLEACYTEELKKAMDKLDAAK